MEEQTTFAGIGSACYIINKKDLQPDSLTPKEGKEWTKVDLKEMKPLISHDIVRVDPSDIKVNVFDPYVRHFRKSRLRIKFRKKLMHYLVCYAGHEPFDRIVRDIYLYSKAAPTTRSMSKALNKKIKLAKRGNYER